MPHRARSELGVCDELDLEGNDGMVEHQAAMEDARSRWANRAIEWA